jgi:hypothetical protein
MVGPRTSLETCACLTKGSVGKNDAGQLGDATTVDPIVPVRVNTARLEGLELVEEALKRSEISEECWKDAELHWLGGEIVSAHNGNEYESEASFRRALAVAQRRKRGCWRCEPRSVLVDCSTDAVGGKKGGGLAPR